MYDDLRTISLLVLAMALGLVAAALLMTLAPQLR